MALLDSLKNLLGQYTSGTASEQDAAAHFQQMAQSVDASTLAPGIAAAMRSDQTPPFNELVAHLFSNAPTDQKAAMLNSLLGAMSPEQRATVDRDASGSHGWDGEWGPGVGTVAGRGRSGRATGRTAQSVDRRPHEHVLRSAPDLVRTLGTAAMMIAMRKIAERHA